MRCACWIDGGALLSIVAAFAGCARAATDDIAAADAADIVDAASDVGHHSSDAGSFDGGPPNTGYDSGPPYDSGPVTWPDAGPIGGGDAGGSTSACTGKTRIMTTSDLFIADFESSGLSGWYDYQATGALNLIAVDSPGALGTARDGHLAANGLTSFGAGIGFGTSCWDTSSLDGISFWAKGTAGGDNKFQFQVAIPKTHAVANGGDCVAKCFDHPSKQLVFTPTWTQYVVPFNQLAQAGWGTPASYSGVIMALNWVSVDAANVDFWVDEVALYKGTASVNPVGGGVAPPVDAGSAD